MGAFIDAHRATYGVEPIWAVLPIAPSTDYAAKAEQADPTRRSARAQRDAVLGDAIARVWRDNRRVYGARKVWRTQLTGPPTNPGRFTSAPAAARRCAPSLAPPSVLPLTGVRMRTLPLVVLLLLFGFAASPVDAQARAGKAMPRCATLECAGPRLPVPLSVQTWSLATASPLSTPASVPDSVRTYRREGSWIGLGVGVALGAVLWATCGSDDDSCSTSEKTLYSGIAVVGGTLLGRLIGSQIAR